MPTWAFHALVYLACVGLGALVGGVVAYELGYKSGWNLGRFRGRQDTLKHTAERFGVGESHE